MVALAPAPAHVDTDTDFDTEVDTVPSTGIVLQASRLNDSMTVEVPEMGRVTISHLRHERGDVLVTNNPFDAEVLVPIYEFADFEQVMVFGGHL